MNPALPAAALRSVGWAGACTRRLDGLCWLSVCFGLVTQLTNGFLVAARRVPSLLGLAPLFSPGLLSLEQAVVLCRRSGGNMGQPFPAPPGSRLRSCQRKCPWSLLPKPQKAAWPRPRRSATPACSAAAGRLCRSPLKVFQRAFRCAAQGSLSSIAGRTISGLWALLLATRLRACLCLPELVLPWERAVGSKPTNSAARHQDWVGCRPKGWSRSPLLPPVHSPASECPSGSPPPGGAQQHMAG